MSNPQVERRERGKREKERIKYETLDPRERRRERGKRERERIKYEG